MPIKLKNERTAPLRAVVRLIKKTMMLALPENGELHENFSFVRDAVLFQPIADTAARRILGYETLAAEDNDDDDAISSAMVRISRLQPANLYFAGLKAISGTRVRFKRAVSPERFVAEIRESAYLDSPAGYHEAWDELRHSGFGLAIDDAGLSPESLRLICELKPDYVKINQRVVQGSDRPSNATIISKMVELEKRCGFRVIAQGVDRLRTVENMWLLGVQCMQGNLFGRPARDLLAGASRSPHQRQECPDAAQSDQLHPAPVPADLNHEVSFRGRYQ